MHQGMRPLLSRGERTTLHGIGLKFSHALIVTLDGRGAASTTTAGFRHMVGRTRAGEGRSGPHAPSTRCALPPPLG